MKKVFAILYEPQENGNITLSFYDIESGELLQNVDLYDVNQMLFGKDINRDLPF